MVDEDLSTSTMAQRAAASVGVSRENTQQVRQAESTQVQQKGKRKTRAQATDTPAAKKKTSKSLEIFMSWKHKSVNILSQYPSRMDYQNNNTPTNF